MLQIKLSFTFFFALTLFASRASISDRYPIFTSTPEPTEEWQVYTILNDVRIEFKRKTCTPIHDREQNLILFRYTNLSSDTKTISWSTKIWRDDFCVNCERIENSEHAFSITLTPGQVLEGDGSTKAIKSLYIFDNFVTLIPGMTDDRLTDFELVNLIVE